MQYKNTTKIIIDKRKLDVLIRLGCQESIIWERIKTGKIIKTGDDLIDENLETFMDVKEFSNWGGKRLNSGNKKKKGNQDEKQVDNHLDNQDINHLADKDKDIDKDIDNNISRKFKKPSFNEIMEIINEIENEEMRSIVEEWVKYKKEKKESYTPMGLKKCISKLENYSNNDPNVARMIIDSAMSNGYAGFFPLKEQQPRQQGFFAKQETERPLPRSVTKEEIDHIVEQRKKDADEDRKRAEEANRRSEWLKAKGYPSVIALMAAGQETYKRVMEEYNKTN